MAGKLRKTAILLVIALAVIAIAAAVVVHLYRDAIALEVANRVLADSDISVTDVAVESIGADYVRFEEILLELSSGSRLEVSGVSLPVKFPGFRGLRLHIDSVVMVPGAGDPGPPRIAEGIMAYFDAAPRMQGAAIEVDEILLADTPPIRDLAWYVDELNPTLKMSIDGLDAFLTSTPLRDEAYRATLRVLTAADVEALFMGFILSADDGGFVLHGDGAVRLEPMIPILRVFAALPEDVAHLSGTLRGPFEIRVDSNEAATVPVTAELAADGDIETLYRVDEKTVFDIRVSEASSVVVSFEYPTLDWTTEIANSRLSVSGGGFESLPVELSATQCSSGVSCTTRLATSIDDIAVGGLSIDGARLSAESVNLVSNEGNWQAGSDSARLVLDSPAYAGKRFVAPIVDASFVASNESVATTLRISTPDGALSGRTELKHDMLRGTGEMDFDDVSLDLALLPASEAFIDWPFSWDVTSGTWRIAGSVKWMSSAEGFEYSGQSVHTADSLAGAYDDIGFVGLNAVATLNFESGKKPTVDPVPMEIALVDVGFPIEDIEVRFTPDIEALAANVESVRMSSLGGELTVAPFRFGASADSNAFLVKVKSIQLPLMVGLADLESVSISGSVTGDIPVTLTDGKVIVDGGLLEADPPGGAIRYATAGGSVDDNSQLGIVTRTLENFEFDELTSEVNYNEDGDLTMQMRLTGLNPDVDPDQPVILNLGVENNVPQMLRSLQATRSIEEILERKLSK